MANKTLPAIMPDAVSVPYPYSRTLDENGPLHLSACVENSAEIDRFCKKHNLSADSYIRGALLCALLRIVRQDGLVLFCNPSGDETQTLLPLVGSMGSMEFSADKMLKFADMQFSKASQLSANFAEVHFLYTPELLTAIGEDVPKGDLIHFFSGKSEDGCYTLLSLAFNPELYSRRDMQALLDAWQMLVTEFCRQDCPVNRLPIVTPEERDRLLALGDGDIRNPYNPDDYDLLPEDVTIVENFMHIAHESPQKIIVVDSEGSYTCEQLNLYSNKVAHWLIAKGIPQNSVIGILTPRCKEYVALAFGVLKACCAVVTLEEDYPEERRRHIIEDARVQMVLTLDTLTEILDSDAGNSDICLCTVDSTFQIFFTSGTTGKPKGVVRALSEITHENNNATLYGVIHKHTATINIVRFSFVASVADVWQSISYGKTLHILPDAMVANPSAVAAYIKANNITFALMPSSYGAMLVNNFDLPLDNLFLSAEKMQPIRNNKVKITNLYACTEVLWVSSKIVDTEDTHLTAGVPQVGVQIYILDESQNLLPQGTVGEVCISSNTMAREYLNDSELNAIKFISNPFVQGKRMLRSGDLGYFDENGELNIVGRTDNMVKLRGFRIELDEITFTAMKCQGIDMCACTKVAKGSSEALCCYYTSATGVCENVLKEYLSKRFPPYMVPDIYMYLDRMPLNANGKIDRKALPEPEYKAESIVLPATKDERQVLEIVEKMMEFSPVSVTANLISLGLSSISAMRLAMRISKEIGKDVTMSQLMSAPTIRDIAANLSIAENSGLGQVRKKQEYYPLTDNQLGVFLDWEQHREELQYNIPYVLKLKGYNAEKLKAAVETVVAAHPYLKSRLAIVDGEVLLQRRDEDKLECIVKKLDVEPDTAFFQSRVRPFDLFEDSLCRLEIYTCGEDIYLFLDIHHIITDGLSNAMLTAEIFKAYNGEIIEPETFTAFDRAIEEQEIKQTEAYTNAEEYYRNLLKGLESTSYPHSTSSLGNGKAGYIRQTLDKSAIEEHCARLGVTASNYLLTVFMEVLKRITREEKVLITAVSSGREHAAMQDIQGFFVKTLPVVSADTVAEVQSQLIESISHECYPLTEMVQQMGIRPEIMYAYEGGLFENDNAALRDEMEAISLRLDTAKVPLTLTVNPDGRDFDLSIEYDDSIYNEADMQTLLHGIIVLAENYAKQNAESKDAFASLQDCPMLTEDEEQRLIKLGTGETLDYDRSKTFIDLFREQAAKTPNAVAVVDKNSQLTYRELDEASDEYAKIVVPGTFVCLEMPRVKEFVVAVLGIWKAGSAYVPIDTEYPEERKKFMRQECDGKPLPQPDVAYMIYTSGSTGKPKGVMVQHSAYLNYLHFYVRQQKLTSSDRMACHRNLSFDASLEDLYPILSVGGELHLMPEEIRMDVDSIRQFIIGRKITCCSFTTSLGSLLLQAYPDLPLRYMVVSGEKLLPIENLQVPLWNFYGPTECTVDCVTCLIEPGKTYTEVPIGKTVNNLAAFVMDSRYRLLPQGASGELCIAGPQLALGYYNNQELTAEKFVDVTIAGKTVKIYKTGDLCRWNSNGLLEYIGRIDNQVKLRGFRIELGELESAALQIEGIRQAVAMVRNEQIVLYYTGIELRGESLELRENRIKQELSPSLPSYMVPSAFVRLDAMPLTPNGKIDRKALPEPEYKAENIVLPATKNEQQVLGIVESLMSVSPISVTDNLISLGLTSNAAMRLAMRISKELRCGITMSQLMSAPTVRDIAANLSVAENSGLGQVRKKQEYYPLTANQIGVYLDWEQHREELQYNIPYVLKLKGSTCPEQCRRNAEKLKAAVESVVAAHPYLKARLAVVNGEVVLQRMDDVNYECTVTELGSTLSVGELAELFQSRVRPFNLFGTTVGEPAEPTLCRFEIYTCGEDVYLFLDIHHIITDGLSDAMLTAEIFRAFNGEFIETETFTAFDRALEEQEIKQSEAYSQAENYYRNLLANLESTSYPHSTSELGKGKAGYVRRTLGKSAIKEHCSRLGVTASNYLLTVFMEVLKRITREDKVLITTINSGREHAAMQDIQGFFVKTLPVVSADTVAEVQSQLIESISHECYPLTEMVQSLGIRPEIMYAYEGGLFNRDNAALRNEIEAISLSLDTAKVPLTLTVNPDGRDFDLSIEYDDSIYNEADMQTLLHGIIVLAENYAKQNAESKDAFASLQDCPMLTEDEEQRLIELGTGETLDYDRTKTFIDLFREQAAKTPDAVAVVDKNSQLTYRELDEASDKYAKSVIPGTFVCVEMPRVKEFVVAVLGIWKAGSAYVPIDTEYPEERKKFMRQECDGKPLPSPDIAYMIYTSGSTGKPKGVMVQHGAYLNYLHFYVHQQRLTSLDRMACHRNLSFDASLEDLYPILSVGGELHLMPEEIRMDVDSIRQFIIGRKITCCSFTTSLGSLLLQAYPDLPLRYMVVSGEKLLPIENLQVPLWNFYGPTECTVDCVTCLIEPGKTYTEVPIGKTVNNLAAFVMDSRYRLLSQGASGELCIAGPQLALGYYNNTELTAEQFVDVTIGGKAVKTYKTGDLCRWNADGLLEYIGRIDNQVKLRGFRIELGEIESSALQIEGIRQAVAMVRNERIVLYYTQSAVNNEDADKLNDRLSEALSSSLPEYMVPSAFVLLDAMPLTPNGKIDRKALPEPTFVQEEYVAPRNDAERVIAYTFKEVLNLNDEVSVTSRFYSLGGDSIKSIRLVSLLSQKGYRLSVADVMKLQTPEALAAVAVSADAEEESFSLPFPIEKHYPLTPMQEAMLLKQLSEPDSWGYRLVSRYRLNVIPTEMQLRTALDALAVEHETLRTRIIYKDVETPEQEITERAIPLSFEDIRKTGRTPEDIHTEQLNLGFDLQEDPLMRVVCIITGENECQLLIAMHHIITDGWSLPIYLGHLFQHLRDALDGKDVSVTDTDAGLFEQHVRSLMLRDKEDSLSYWKNLLDGYETKAEIVSYENISVEEKESANDHLNSVLDTEQTEKLKAVCAANGATLSHATELAWGIVLQRYTRLDDVVFAKVVSCRDKAPMDMSGVVGPFINSIPVRVKADGNCSLSEALQSVSNQAADSNAHDYCSLSEIQRLTYTGGNLFQSILAFENYPVSDEIRRQLDEGEDTLRVVALDNQEESFNDITLTAFERDSRLQLNLTFDKEKFSETEMRNVLSAWKQVLIQTADTPDMSVAETRLLSEDEEQRLIELGTGETLDYDRSKTFIDLFREQAAKTPNAVAVVYKDIHFTYKELDEITDRLAVKLHTSGVAPEVTVGVLIERSELMAVYPLAIMKAGGAYMPLDPTFPEERLLYMCKDAGLSLILSDEGLAENVIPTFEGSVIGSSLLRLLPEVTDDELSRLPRSAPGNRFVVLYTSGSTGKPKGVVLENHSIVNFCHWYEKTFEMTSADRTLAYASFGFDAHMIDLYPALLCGAGAVILTSEGRLDVEDIVRTIRERHITVAFFTTQIAKLLFEPLEKTCIRVISYGGEQTPPVTIRSFEQYHVYGPTECTLFSSFHKITKECDNPPIGASLPGYSLLVVDTKLHLVKQGMTGELVVAGEGLARGYLDNPELTAERFTNITIGGRTVKVYKTGDLCRWNADGQLEFMGRIDNQIKLRGFRIELGEIESAALQVEGVQQAVAMVRNERIVLYYVNDGSTSSPTNKNDGSTGLPTNKNSIKQELSSSLSSSLPSYMVPSAFVQLDAMPLTPNGKIDRKALPEPEYKAENIVLPATKNEQQVLGIVESLMSVSPISVTDNLISLGLTSIAAMRLAMRISKELRCGITMSQLMSAPTVRDIVANLSVAENSGLGQVRKKQEYYPLTANQLGVYLDWEQHREELQYNIPYVLKLKGYNADRLKAAVGAVVAAHPYLKARLAVVDGEVLLQRKDEDKFECFVKELDIEPDTDASEESVKNFFQSRVRPFDLFEDSLCRFEIYTYEKDVYLFLDIHHIITDGLSDARLESEIFRAYSGEAIETETFTAFDRAIEEQEIKQTEAYTNAEEYYRNLLSGLDSTSYPHSTSELGNGKAGYVRQALDKSAIEQHCSRLGVTASNYLLTVFMEVLKRITREDKVLITTINSGREYAAMQDIQGFFVKTLPVVSADTVAKVQSQLIESISHECYPLTEMVQSLGIRPEIMYAYEGGLFENDNAALRDEMEAISLRLDTAKVPLTLTVNPDGRDFDLSIEYDDSIYNEADMQTLLHGIIVLAENYAKQNAESKDAFASLQECSLLSEEEEQRLIKLGTGETLDYDRSKTFIDLFREQAKKTPDAVAVVDGFDKLTNRKCSQLTYKELDEASDEYAKGVRPGSFVCLEMPRVKEFVVAVLGIWKAGSAYVPIDTEYPEERKKYMRQECDGKSLPSPDIAYMIYTSGSTGRPKGVMIRHLGMLNYVLSVVIKENLSRADRIAAYRSFSFDSHIEDLYPILSAGGTLFIIPEEYRKEPNSLKSFLFINNITGIGLPTQMAKLLIKDCSCPNLRYISAGGERLDNIYSPYVDIINEYGPTECTVEVSYYTLAKGTRLGSIPIGHPLPNTSCFVIDGNQRLLPRGVVGELAVSGSQLALGYYNNLELTAERFVDIAIGGRTVKIYKTGDLCRWNENGQLEYIGRIDNQVKLRGFRIELGEIESAALQIEGIRQAVAMVRNERIVLYYTQSAVDNENADKLNDRLSEALSSSLPEYMVPSAFVLLDAMPLTPNGKIDRKALPEPETKETEYVAPQSRNEKLLCKMVESLLKLERVGITDSFTALGMSSIQSMRFNLTMYNYGISVGLEAILKADNILTLCRIIDEGKDRTCPGKWLQEYNQDKKTVVLCCGVTSSDKITSQLTRMKKKYNIYVLQPIFNAWSDIENIHSHEEIVERYYLLIKNDIHGTIDCIMGFSYGGEIAYSLAMKWETTCGEKPLVIMGDTNIYQGGNKVEYTQTTTQDEIFFYYYELEAEFFSKLSITSIVNDYSGDVILLSALKVNPNRLLNEQAWKQEKSDIRIVPMNDEHTGLYRHEEYFDLYTELIEEYTNSDISTRKPD